ncbi:TolC family protein [Shewanella chilikensis]|uniref:TolC family protein n=1 Tax=Shewanella chilikensis TaxID=558541 RepID=UPI001F2BB5C5|nr:TolC family protein [Shewanella chilikensis]MCE9786453.1 TolC family protein [Shewanella chilikensis]
MTGQHSRLVSACNSILSFTSALVLVGCASNAVNMAPASSDQPWIPDNNEDTTLWSLSRANQRTSADAIPSFTIPVNPVRAKLEQNEWIDFERSYDLPELIDLAQHTNPKTRAAWQQARQAAIAVGMVEATYLPIITASVVAGSQTLTVPLPDLLGNKDVENTEKGTTQVISLQWLLFDFGQRESLVEETKHVAIAANILFNGSHQRVIFEVSQAYYAYGAAIQRSIFAGKAFHNAEMIQVAVEARAAQGVATSIEVVQARQALAQAELRRVQAKGDERVAYQNLLAAVGVNAELKVDAQRVASQELPTPYASSLEELIRQALSQRPDVAASYAALQASKAGIEAAKAGYLPKVYLGGNISWGSGNFDASGLPSIGQQGTGSGVLLGITVPIYDGGLRDAQIREAKSKAETAADEFQSVQTAAVTEIVAAYNALKISLESYQAASVLVAAASTTYEATLAAYQNGVGTIDAVTTADTALLDARQAQGDAHAAALASSINLAFVVGALTSREHKP